MRFRLGLASVVCAVVILVSGCRREQQAGAVAAAPDEPPPAAANESQPAEEVEAAAPDAGSAAPIVAQPARPDEPIDLLRGARTALAVSSAYRNKLAQAARLVDGELATAWNSRTGDLVGAWIEVRLPEDATVTSVVMTSGFTKSTTRGDLFDGNHRVSKVRVLRAGREIGVYDLDTESRELQTLPVKGAGGVYRIEIVNVVPGTKARWREVCVSELRFMGHAPTAHPGKRFPRLGVGEMPEPRPRPGTADKADVRRRFRGAVEWLVTEWGNLIDEQVMRDTACGLSDEEDAAAAGYRNQRRLVFGQMSKLVALVDEVQADQLRRESYKVDPRGHSGWSILHPSDHGYLSGGYDVVAEWLGDDETTCRWSKADMGLRLELAVNELEAMNHDCEHLYMGYDDEEPPADAVRQCHINERLMPRVGDLQRLWQSNPRQAAARIARIEWPESAAALMSEWVGVEYRVEILRPACGWVSE